MPATVSIIIPSLRADSLRPLLQALAEQTAAASIVDVIIAGQQDLSDCTDFEKVVYVPVDEQPTPARNRNAASRRASGDWFCFTDADCCPARDWVERYLEAAHPGRAALAGSVALPPQMPYWGRCDHYLGFENQAAGFSQAGELEYAATLNFCCRADVFRELGGFDERFETAGGEDRDFSWRLAQTGYAIYGVPQARVVHQHYRTTFRSVWQHIYHYGQVTAQFRYRQQEQASKSWKTGKRIAALPALGEAAALVRATGRLAARLLRQPALLKQPALIPGIAVLDVAHTMGMIATIRSYGA